MNSYVALIRGINVGGKNSLPMAVLTQALEDIGCQHVRTFIQSGNVVFQSASRPAQLTDEIAMRLLDAVALNRMYWSWNEQNSNV
jgi:uncharacterized protein (DUF1697 family)